MSVSVCVSVCECVCVSVTVCECECVCVCVCVCVPCTGSVHRSQKKASDSSSDELLTAMWVLGIKPGSERVVLLTTEPSLQTWV